MSPHSPSPSHKHSDKHRVLFLHPAYPDYHNQLLDIFAFDAPDSANGGIHCGTAFLACAIVSQVAGNSRIGLLTEPTRDGNRVEHQVDETLRKEQYYFHSPTPEAETALPVPLLFSFAGSSYHKYSVYPAVQHWKVSSAHRYSLSDGSRILYLSVSTK